MDDVGIRANPAAGSGSHPADSGPDQEWPATMVDVPVAPASGSVRLCLRRATAAAPRPPALLVHGLGGASTDWTDLIAALGPVLDGYAPDLPGFGHSPVPPPDLPRPFSVRTSARVLAALIDSRGLPPVHLVGSSLGGAVALHLAASRPDLVRSLTLVDAALPRYRVNRSTWHMPIVALPVLGLALARRFTISDPERRLTALLAVTFAHPEVIPEHRRRQAVEELRRRAALGYDLQVTLAALRGLLSAYLWPGGGALWREARGLSVPTLVVHGLADQIVPAQVGRRAARVIPGARLLLLPETGHLAMLERPALVAAGIRDLVAAVEAGR